MRFFGEPLTRDLELDDPRTTELRRQVIRKKDFLRQVYEEWYCEITSALPEGDSRVLELGSGGGFLSETIPNLIRSEIIKCQGIDVLLDGARLPLASACLRGIVMTNVLHHIADVRQFFSEASRCLKYGGSIIMIEPWMTNWSRFVFGKLHHEPCFPDRVRWEFESRGPLSGANEALPWIIFERDRKMFENEFSSLEIQKIKRIMPVRYLLSGGVSKKSLMPGWTFQGWRMTEELLEPWMRYFAMFAVIVLVKK